MQRRILVTFIFVAFAIALVLPVVAQDGASGLANPRQMSFDADGNLYVAEAGVGGDQMSSDESAFGATSQISMISPDGEVSVVLSGFVSYGAGSSRGVSAVQATDTSLWVLLGEIANEAFPFGDALVEIDKETKNVVRYIDLAFVELEMDPDGNPNGEMNPTDFAVMDDGTVVIAAAGCNCLVSWADGAGVELVASWSHADDNPVPTSVDVDANGDIYVGFLTGFPFPEGGARIERWSGGELAETFEGLTAVTDVLVTDDGVVYAVEHGFFAMGEGWAPGRVVMASADGVTPVLEDLTSPYGLAMSPDGTLFVNTGSTGGADGTIVAVPMS